MNEAPLVIRGGTLVTGFGTQDADVWIKDGKIVQILAKERLKKQKTAQPHVSETQEFDGARYFILPGLVYTGQVHGVKHTTAASYIQEIRTLVGKGYTTMLDTVRMDEWMNLQQFNYRVAPHFNNVVDYCIQVELSPKQVKPRLVRMLGRNGTRLLQITIRDLSEMNAIQWDILYPILQHYRMSMQLAISLEKPPSRAMQQDLMELWLRIGSEGKVRMRMEVDNPLHAAENALFYHLYFLRKEQSSKVIRHFLDHWYSHVPIYATLDRFLPMHSNLMQKRQELLSLLVRLCSTNAAKALGIYPQKGCLQIGADADFLFVEKSTWLTNFDLSTILNSSEICLASYVMAKGRWILREGTHAPVVGCGNELHQLRPYSFMI